MLRFIKIFLIFAVSLIIGFTFCIFLFKDMIVDSSLERFLTNLSGFKTKIEHTQVDLFHSTITAKGLIMFNPKGFDRKIFLEAPEVSVALDWVALLKKEAVHFRNGKLWLEELNIEKNKKGIYNFSLLGSNPDEDHAAEKQPPVQAEPDSNSSTKAESSSAMPFRLDRFELTLRRVNYADYSSLVPKKASADFKIQQEVFEKIENFGTLVQILILKAIRSNVPEISSFALQQLALGGSDKLQDTLKGTIGFGNQFLKDTTDHLIQPKTATELIQLIGNTANNVIDTTGKQTTGTLGQLLNAITVNTPALNKGISNQAAKVPSQTATDTEAQPTNK